MSQAVETETVPTRIGPLHVELRRQGPSVLCWPSLYCDARTLDSMADDLARDHRVLVVDGPGHGKSGASPGRFSFDEDLVPVLAEVRIPTLFFAGAEDTLFPVDEAQRQAAAIPECRFVVVERSSHQSALEAPERVLPVVREALAEWSARV
jgi:pimeloyl-ACP methyl ester carboxylesterase